MDYEKAYKQLVDNFGSILNLDTVKESGVISVEDVRKLIPKLKESEDERIKTFLHHTFTAQYLCKDKLGKWHGEPVINILAWLEKQGAKVSAIEGFETEFERQVSCLIASAINKEHEYNQGYVKWTANALLNYAKHELEKQGQQKPAEWSEEDEANLDYLIDFCNGYYNGNKPVLTESTARSLSNWLYRLKSCEIISKPNKIDNEEAEKTIHLACEFIRHRMESNGNIGGVDYAELINRLKSLRPQNRLKTDREDEGKDKAYGIVDKLPLPEKCKACIWGPLPSDTHGEDSDLTCHFVGTCNNFDRFKKREG